jgi:hypothetical protein
MLCPRRNVRSGATCAPPQLCNPPTSAPGLGTPSTSAPGLGSPRPHLHRDWAHPAHICTGAGLTPPTSAPGPPPTARQVRLALAAEAEQKKVEVAKAKALQVCVCVCARACARARVCVCLHVRACVGVYELRKTRAQRAHTHARSCALRAMLHGERGSCARAAAARLHAPCVHAARAHRHVDLARSSCAA